MQCLGDNDCRLPFSRPALSTESGPIGVASHASDGSNVPGFRSHKKQPRDTRWRISFATVLLINMCFGADLRERLRRRSLLLELTPISLRATLSAPSSIHILGEALDVLLVCVRPCTECEAMAGYSGEQAEIASPLFSDSRRRGTALFRSSVLLLAQLQERKNKTVNGGFKSDK